MARPLRIEFPGAFYHVSSHGNGRLWLFRNDEDCKKFLDILGLGVERYKVRVHAFVLMRNHIHLLLETPLGNLSKLMRQILSEYGIYYNNRYNRKGSVFKPRYGAFVVQKDKYYHSLIRYIYINPVKAGIAKSASNYRWSSLYYLINKSKLKDIKWFDLNYVYSILKSNKEIMELIESSESHKITKVYRFFIADEDWAHDIIKRNRHKLSDKNISGIKDIVKEFKVEENLNKIWNSLNIGVEELIKNKRDPYYKAVVYILREMFPLTNREIGEMMDNTEQAISKIYSRIRKKPEKYTEVMKIVEDIKEMSSVKT
jgi:REP element-mobilizing transposase RayT